jgi:hypothetical protein
MLCRGAHVGPLAAAGTLQGIIRVAFRHPAKRPEQSRKNDGSDLEIVADAAASYSEIDSEPQ